MKRIVSYIIVGVLILLLLGVFLFQKSFQPKALPSQKVVSVKVITVVKETMTDYAKYVGVIKGETISKLSFQVPGKVSKVYTQKGELVTKGAALAEVEPDRLELGTAASTAQIISANNQVTKAKEAYEFSLLTFNNTSALFQSGGASQNDYDRASLNLELAKADLKSAQEQRQLAVLQGEQNQLNLNDAIVYAPFDGYVIDVLTEIGETTGAGVPVMVFRSPEQVIEVGVTQKDYSFFNVGTSVTVNVDGLCLEGQVALREEYPDGGTRTYRVEVKVEQGFPIGALCTVEGMRSELIGFKLPIMSLIYNDNVNVFRSVDNQVELVEVEVLKLIDDYAIVGGLNEGDAIVTEGIKRLKVGDTVVHLK